MQSEPEVGAGRASQPTGGEASSVAGNSANEQPWKHESWPANGYGSAAKRNTFECFAFQGMKSPLLLRFCYG